MTMDELEALPPARQPHRRPSRARPRQRHRGDDRPARPGARQCGRHGARRAPARRRSSATSVVDHHTYVFCGDGCLMEGISHEALSLAGHLRLDKLIVLYDDNSISIDGPTELAVSDDQVAALSRRMAGRPSGSTATTPTRSPPRSSARSSSDRPSLIACRTIIAFGAPTKAGTAAAHGSPLGADEIKGARERLGWNYPALRHARRRPRAVARGRRARRIGAAAWEARLQALDAAERAEFPAPPAPRVAAGLDDALAEAVRRIPQGQERQDRDPPGLGRRCSTRWSPVVPELVGGSADLTPVEQHQGQGPEGGPPRRLLRPLYPLRRARARHGGGDERHRRAWRAHPLWRHVPDLLRLLPAVDPAVGADGSSASSM